MDGRIGFCGGVGIDDRWKGDARNPSEWRDTMIEIEGPVVAQLQHIFAQDWVHTTGEVLNGDRQFPEIAPAGTMLAQAIAASRADSISMSKLLLYMAIQAARQTHLDRERVLRAGPADPRGPRGRGPARRRREDHRARRRTSTSPNVRAASHYHYGELLEGGVGIYEYRPTMMHNKVMVGRRDLVDDRLDQLRQPLDEEERRGQRRGLRPRLRGPRSRRWSWPTWRGATS